MPSTSVVEEGPNSISVYRSNAQEPVEAFTVLFGVAAPASVNSRVINPVANNIGSGGNDKIVDILSCWTRLLHSDQLEGCRRDPTRTRERINGGK
jgi:hypothetical protein